jgi:hypothetical protein
LGILSELQLFSRFQACQACGYRTAMTRTTLLQPPTQWSTGYRERCTECFFCLAEFTDWEMGGWLFSRILVINYWFLFIYLLFFIPQQRTLMGSSARNSSGVHWCRCWVRFNRVPKKVPERFWRRSGRLWC